jgi:hypothetical protein
MEDILERAKRRLDEMAVVGTVERFPESIGLICEYLGIAEPKTPIVMNVAPKHRVTASHREAGTVSPKLAALIDSITTYDRELYDYGSQLLDARLNSRSRTSAD